MTPRHLLTYCDAFTGRGLQAALLPPPSDQLQPTGIIQTDSRRVLISAQAFAAVEDFAHRAGVRFVRLSAFKKGFR
jgi:hypothetical protein